MRRTIPVAITFGLVALLGNRPVLADETTRISNAMNGHAGDAQSCGASMSSDGNYIVFTSYADDIVAGDTNHAADIFVVDRNTGAVERVSVSSSGAEGNGDSLYGTLSADGRYVTFASFASNLANDPNGNVEDIFVHDRVAGTTTLISIDSAGKGGNGNSWWSSISGDGQKIAFSSDASNLVANDVNGATDSFLWDAKTGVITLVSADLSGVQGNADTWMYSIDANGDLIGFTSFATNFPHTNNTGYWSGVFVKDLITGELERVDVDSSGIIYGTESEGGLVSDDGNVVAFDTVDSLVSDDSNARSDVYVRERHSSTTKRVSVASDGSEIHDGFLCIANALSSDGRFVVIWSDSMDLVDDKSTDNDDVFVHDRVHGTTTRVSVGTYDEEGNGNSWSGPGGISTDGRRIIFNSEANNFAPDDNPFWILDVFLRDRSLIPASSTNYGAGYPGRHGNIPSLTAREMPWRGATLDVDIGNSSNYYIVAFLLIGLTRDDIPTKYGGSLLLDPIVTIPIPLIPSGGTFTSEVPTDYWANGLVVDLQALELDPWAAYGVSFTPGLELTLGDG